LRDIIFIFSSSQSVLERVFRYKLNKITILWTLLLDKIDYHAVTTLEERIFFLYFVLKYFFFCLDLSIYGMTCKLTWLNYLLERVIIGRVRQS
jgi:hypothetical protein